MPEGLPDVNLLPKYERQRSGGMIIFIAFIIFIFIAYILLGTYYFTTKNKMATIDTTHEQLVEEKETLETQVEQLEAEGSPSLDQMIDFVENHNIPTSSFITELDYFLPDHSYLSEYEYGSQEAKVSIHFETLDTVANYTTKLTMSDYIIDTKVDVVETFMLEEDKQDFDTIPRYDADFILQINQQ